MRNLGHPFEDMVKIVKLHHPTLASRWPTLGRATQILNLVSELHRVQRWLGTNPEYFRLSLERALELIDFCVDDRTQWRGNRLRELLRLRETTAAFYVDAAAPGKLPDIIQAALLLDPSAAAALPRHPRPAGASCS